MQGPRPAGAAHRATGTDLFRGLAAVTFTSEPVPFGMLTAGGLAMPCGATTVQQVEHVEQVANG